MGHCYKKYKFLFFLVSGIVFTGLFLTMPACNTVLTKDSGSIDYEISYADSMKKDIMASMLPSKMNFKFIPGTTLNEFKVGMGIITATFIANEETKTLTSLFKVIDKKYALIYSPEETKAELDKLPKFKIVLSGESKKIAGYTCKKAILSQVGKEGNTFAVFYTTEIKVKNPNWNLPYAEIHGVLMEYQIQHKDILMVLKAKKVILEAPDAALFSVAEDYKVVKKDELPEIIQSFF